MSRRPPPITWAMATSSPLLLSPSVARLSALIPKQFNHAELTGWVAVSKVSIFGF